MDLIIILGNGAVGKMSVGQALMEQSGFRLFHNHMTIEPVIEIFGTYHSPVVSRMREVIFEEFIKTDHRGLIFTYMMAFDLESEWTYIEGVANRFKASGGQVYFVELIADQSVRLARNMTENRLKHKASKRDLIASEKRLIEADNTYRCESYEGEVTFENYLRIDNSKLSPEVVAKRIIAEFSL